VTIEGVCTANDYIADVTITHRLVYSVTMLGSVFQRRTFLCSVLTSLQVGYYLTPTTYSNRWLQLVLPSAAIFRAELTFQLPTSKFSSQFSTGFRGELPYKVRVKVILRPTVSLSVCLVSKPHLGPNIRFLLLSGSCGFVHVGRPLWREHWSVVYNCYWSSPAQSYVSPMKSSRHFVS
jgi:hypothetical protein